MVHDFEPVLRLWFGQLDAAGRADEAHSARWWRKDPDFDALLRDELGDTHAAVASCQCEDWLSTDRGRLAYVIVLDQLSRNMFRDTPRMFAHDDRALEVALEGIELGVDGRLAHDERSFLYMPLMHSEQLAVQDRLVELLVAWRDGAPEPLRQRIEYTLDFAERHRAIVRRFGRFPHRNQTLGRASTPEELEFSKQPGSSF